MSSGADLGLIGQIDVTQPCSQALRCLRPSSPTGHRALLVLALLSSAALVGGCNNSSVSTGSGGLRSNPTAVPLTFDVAAGTNKQSPASVAEHYVEAIGRGDFAAATSDVADRYQATMKAISDGNPNLSPGASDAPVSDVSIASVTVTGSDATVVWTGKLCAYDASIDDIHCVENTDSKSENPLFVVKLHEEDNGDWKVVLGY